MGSALNIVNEGETQNNGNDIIQGVWTLGSRQKNGALNATRCNVILILACPDMNGRAAKMNWYIKVTPATNLRKLRWNIKKRSIPAHSQTARIVPETSSPRDPN